MVQGASASCFTRSITRSAKTGPRRVWSRCPIGTLPQHPVRAPSQPGLSWQIFPGSWTELPDLTDETRSSPASRPNLHADRAGFTRYAAAWDGFIDIPADGGYTFHLMSRDGARLVIDGLEVAKTGPPFAQVCGSPGNAMRYDRGSLGLRAGMHASSRRPALPQPGITAPALGRPKPAPHRCPRLRIFLPAPGLFHRPVAALPYAGLRPDLPFKGACHPCCPLASPRSCWP